MREDKTEDDETTDEDEVKVTRREELEEEGKGLPKMIGIIFVLAIVVLAIYCVRRHYKKR